MIRNYLCALLISLIFIACGGGGDGGSTDNNSSPTIPDRTDVLGAWDESDPNCDAFITFSQSLTFNNTTTTLAVAISGPAPSPNLILAQYLFTPSAGRDTLTINILFDNTAADCNGAVGDLTGQTLNLFVEFSGNTMNWFEQSQGGSPVQTFTFNATAGGEHSPLINDPAFVVDRVVITPDPVTTGALTQMMAVVDYTVTDPNGAVIELVFNDQFIEAGIALERPAAAQAQVPQGSGQVTLFRDVTVPDWGNDANFIGAISLREVVNGTPTGVKTAVEQTIQQTP